MKNKNINLIDVTVRDGHQCLWATRMTTAMIKTVISELDNAGFEAIDLVGGAVFDVCVRYLKEDPWERMRLVSSWAKNTPLIIHTRGQSLFTFEFFSDDVVELAAERFVANGMRYHTPYDALNDIRNLKIPIEAAKKNGLHVVPGIVFTESPVHTDDYYSKKAQELINIGVDGVFIKDASGLLRPERIVTLVKSIKSVIKDLPLQLHSHCSSGLSPYVAMKAIENGVEVVHTATSPLANGTSHPPTEQFILNCRRLGYKIDIDLELIDKVAEKITYIAKREDKPIGKPLLYDEFHYHHQMAGGAISNLKYQLDTMGLGNRLEEILDEAGKVRADLGYPIVVSPFASYITAQALLNVLSMDKKNERYSNVPDEVKLYVRGGYGEIAGQIDPNLYDKICKGEKKITQRAGELVSSMIKKVKKKYVSLKNDDDLLLAIFYDEKIYNELKSAGPIKTNYPLMKTPLLTLVKEISENSNISSFHFIDNRKLER